MAHTIRSYTDFDRKLDEAEDKLVVLDFYATWCEPCKALNRTVRALAKKYSGKAVVLRINVDKFPDISEDYNVSKIPAFVFIRENGRKSKLIGPDEKKLETKMASLLKA